MLFLTIITHFSCARYAQVMEGGHLAINARFDSNEAVEYGWGSRAGAVRLQYIKGTVVVDGIYTGNRYSKFHWTDIFDFHSKYLFRALRQSRGIFEAVFRLDKNGLPIEARLRRLIFDLY